MSRLRPRREDGFTLIELLVVMIILGILMAIAIPSYLDQREKGYQANALSDMGNLRTAIETYALDNNGSYAGLDGATQDSPVLSQEGFAHSVWTTLSIKATDTSYCAVGTHTHVPSKEYVLMSNDGSITTEPLTGPGCG